jgi:hypothetical protein
MPLVPYHRFRVGQTVVAPTISGPSAMIPRGQHLIVRLLPVSGRDPQYRIRSSVDGHDRVVKESQIRLADQQPSIAEPPVRTERDGRRYRK